MNLLCVLATFCGLGVNEGFGFAQSSQRVAKTQSPSKQKGCVD
jgi:hypothetical protein